MRARITLQLTADDGTSGAVEEVALLIEGAEGAMDLGPSPAEAEGLLADVQQRVVQHRFGAWATARRLCEDCGRRRRAKGSHPTVFRTLFGDVPVASPRLHRCACDGESGPAAFSPLDRAPGRPHRARAVVPGGPARASLAPTARLPR